MDTSRVEMETGIIDTCDHCEQHTDLVFIPTNRSPGMGSGPTWHLYLCKDCLLKAFYLLDDRRFQES